MSEPWTPTERTVRALAASTPPHKYLPALRGMLDAVDPEARQGCVEGWVALGLIDVEDMPGLLAGGGVTEVRKRIEEHFPSPRSYDVANVLAIFDDVAR